MDMATLRKRLDRTVGTSPYSSLTLLDSLVLWGLGVDAVLSVTLALLGFDTAALIVFIPWLLGSIALVGLILLIMVAFFVDKVHWLVNALTLDDKDWEAEEIRHPMCTWVFEKFLKNKWPFYF